MKQFVMVIGYQRSGTSFLTKALNFCGVDLGEFTDMTYTHINANMANESGDWESKKLKMIYDNFLDSEPTLDDLSNIQKFGLITPENKQLIENYLKSFLQRESVMFGFKLPNILMLEHFMDYHPLLIGIFRNPISNAESCVGRFNSDDYRKRMLPKYVQYWNVHNRIMLDEIDRYGGYLINFDWDSKRIISKIHGICDDLGLLKTDLTNWFRKDLIHHDRHRVDLVLDGKTILLHAKLVERSESNSKYCWTKPRPEIDYSKVLKQNLNDQVLLTKLTNLSFRKIQDENKKLSNSIINRIKRKFH